VEGSPRSGNPTSESAESGGPPHGVNIAQRVGGGNLAEQIWIVNNRREEIGRLDQGDVRRDAIDARIVAGFKSDENIRVGLAAVSPRRTESQSFGLSLAAQPAALAMDVSRTGSDTWTAPFQDDLRIIA